MTAVETFLWHDYETFGTHPALDRPAQFGAIRTDMSLEITGEPVAWYCAPADDMLPNPDACLVTGITPQKALAEGVCEAEFARRVHGEMMQPGTCSAGYNSIRFDDEFTRHLLYRNFRDPYEREYKHGNSRWDLINLARMCYALRPDGLNWPRNDQGQASFRLEHLTEANGIEHGEAHDALADVKATLALARLIRKAQPRLFEWALGLRNQKTAIALLDVSQPQPLVHTSGRIAASRGCTGLFLPLALVPGRPKSVIAIDLHADPSALINEPAESIADLVFTPAADLPDDHERIPLKAIHSNKVPMLAPIQTLRGVDTSRIGLDVDQCHAHAARILQDIEAIRYKVMEVFERPFDNEPRDPELMLYGGDFFSHADRALMNRLVDMDPTEIASTEWPFRDARLPELLFRFRARNYPETLNPAEAERWQHDRRQRLTDPPLHGHPGMMEMRQRIRELREQPPPARPGQLHILDQLEAWYDQIEAVAG
ncbi:MAG: exodeoxyribonuclease I [Xanthomonadales bacterium]|nr:exodeoxyribonuclease I [Gammaproteobacteria bacterium]NNE05510.1 exodeoxyribonuclease I [Xanthomonadales bacterium]NNL94143.1 exodeoxyribonuclease I [Xanthomonadales bacterium]